MPVKQTARRHLPFIVLATAGLTVGALGGASDGTGEDGTFPSDNITLTVGQDAGGSTDLIARAVANESQSTLGTTMTVENQPGANGALATMEVANGPTTGYELVLLNASLVTVTPMTVSEDEAVELDDLEIIAGLSQDDYVMIAGANSGYESIDDVVETDETVTYGTAGVGTASQLAQLLLMAEADVTGNEVSFDSGSPALTAVMGDQVDVATVQVGEAMPQIEAGTVTPLLIFADERIEYLPDVPTAQEEGYDIPVAQYRAVAAPAGISEEVRSTLEEGVFDIFEQGTYQQFNTDNYLTPTEVSGDEVEAEWTELAKRYEQLVEENNIDLGGSN